MTIHGNPKIFIGITEIAGYYGNLQRGFDEIGIKAKFFNLKENPFKYEHQKDSRMLNIYRFIRFKRTSAKRTDICSHFFLKFFQKALKFAIFISAIFQYDVFIFGFSKSFYSNYDLPILRALGKKIIFVFHGTDIRPSFIGGRHRDKNFEQLISIIRRKKDRLSRIERFADVVVSHPLFSHFLKRPFIDWLHIGIPYFTTNKFNQKGSKKIDERIRILHSPSNPEIKGTSKIRASIENLKSKGYPIDYMEILGKPNAIVLSEIYKSDFIVDQIYSDTPMAGFATEAAFAGKPAIVGGYGWKDIEHIYAPDQIPPSYRCHPDELESAIKKLTIDKSLRLSLGVEAKNFVEKHWTAKEVAKRFLRLIDGNAPSEWIYDPKKIRYLHGAGVSEREIKRNIRSIITTGGKEALQLSDKPELERRFFEFTNSL